MKPSPTNSDNSTSSTNRIDANAHGHALNKMCDSFETATNCQKFKAFPEAYCHDFKLNEAEIHAVTDLDVIRMVKAGGKIASLAKLTKIYELDVLELGAQQANQSIEQFTKELQSVSE